MERSEESETAEPQKASLRERSWGQPRERTSVAVSERAQQKDWYTVSIIYFKRERRVSYQIQLLQPLRSIRQIHNSIIRQIRAIRQNELLQLRKFVDTPMLEATIRDRRAAREVHALKSLMSVDCKMGHRSISHVLAIAQCEPLEFRAANHSTDGWDRDILLLVPCGILLLSCCWFCDDPADDTSEEVVADFAAIRQIDFFELFRVVGHFKYSICSDIPHALHLPSMYASTTYG